MANGISGWGEVLREWVADWDGVVNVIGRVWGGGVGGNSRGRGGRVRNIFFVDLLIMYV